MEWVEIEAVGRLGLVGVGGGEKRPNGGLEFVVDMVSCLGLDRVLKIWVRGLERRSRGLRVDG